MTTLPPAEVLAALGSGIPLPDGGIPAALDGAAGMRHAGIPFTDARVSTLPDASILSRRGIYIRLYGRPP